MWFLPPHFKILSLCIENKISAFSACIFSLWSGWWEGTIYVKTCCHPRAFSWLPLTWLIPITWSHLIFFSIALSVPEIIHFSSASPQLSTLRTGSYLSCSLPRKVPASSRCSVYICWLDIVLIFFSSLMNELIIDFKLKEHQYEEYYWTRFSISFFPNIKSPFFKIWKLLHTTFQFHLFVSTVYALDW